MTDYNLNEDTFGNPKSSSSSNKGRFDDIAKQADANLEAGRLETGPAPSVFQQFDPVPFSTHGTDYYRYARRSNFDELGFSPYRDNNSLYNAESNFFGETWRGLQGAAMTAFDVGLDGWTETADILAGNYSGVSDWWNSYDTQAAAEFEDVNRIYGSTKGGATGFIANGLLNTGFIGGMLIGSLPELAIEAVVTAEAGGVGAFAGIGRMFGKGSKALKAADKALDAVEAVKDIRKTQSTIVNGSNSIQEASKLKKALNSSLGDFYFGITDNAIAKALNPFSNTGVWVNDILRAGKLGEDAGDAGKFTRGIGAMMEDLTIIKGAKLESSLEAGFTANEFRQEYINKYIEENGIVPSGDDMKTIDTLAATAASESIMQNMPIIMYTDKLLFNPLFRGARRVSKHLDLGPARKADLPDGITHSKKTGSFDVNGPDVTGMNFKQTVMAKSRYALKGLSKPKTWASLTKTTLGAGIGEGAQEVAQEITAVQLENKYKDMAENPLHLPLQSNASYVTDAVKHLFVDTKDGYHAFASGLFVGGLFGAGGGRMGKLVGLAKKENREKYLEYEQEKRKQLNEIADILNENMKDPYSMFRPELRTYAEMNKLSEEYKLLSTFESLTGGTPEMAQRKKEIADQMLFTRLSTALSTGTYDIFKNKLLDMRSMDDQALLEATGEENVETARQNIDEAIQYAEKVKKTYDDVSAKYPNPFDYSNLSITSSNYARMRSNYDSFEQAKRQLIFLSDNVEKLQEKRQEIENKLRQAQLGKSWSSADTSSVISVASAEREIAILEREVLGAAGATTAEEKKIFQAKKKKLRALKSYKAELEKYFETIDSLKEEGVTEEVSKKRDDAARKLKMKLKNVIRKTEEANVLLGAEASEVELTEQEVDEFLDSVIDYTLTFNEQKEAVGLLESLDNPAALVEFARREQAAKEDVFANKKAHILRSVETFMDSVEKNQILHELKDLGVVIDHTELAAFLNNGVLPTTLYSLKNHQKLNMNNAKAKEALKIMQPYAESRQKTVAETKAKEEEKKGSSKSAETLEELGNSGTTTPPGRNTKRPQTDGASRDGVKGILDKYKKDSNQTNYHFYLELVKENNDIAKLLINYAQNLGIEYGGSLETLLQDPQQGPQFTALLAVVQDVYKNSGSSLAIDEWVKSSEAQNSNSIDEAVSQIYNNTKELSEVLNLMASDVVVQGKIEDNLAEDEDVEWRDEEKDIYITVRPKFIDNGRESFTTDAYYVKNSQGIVIAEIHNQRENFGSLQSAKAAIGVFESNVEPGKSKPANLGTKKYIIRDNGMTVQVGQIFTGKDGKIYKVVSLIGKNENRGTVDGVQLQYIKDGVETNKPIDVTDPTHFGTRYLPKTDEISATSYKDSPKVALSNLLNINYLNDKQTKELLSQAYVELGPQGFLDAIQFEVRENITGGESKVWSVGDNYNSLIERNPERVTIEMYIDFKGQRKSIGFVNDPDSYVFRNYQSGETATWGDADFLIKDVHYQGTDSQGNEVEKARLDAEYQKAKALYDHLMAKKGQASVATVTMEQVSSEIEQFELTFGDPAYIFPAQGEEAVPFSELKHTSFKGKVAIWDRYKGTAVTNDIEYADQVKEVWRANANRHSGLTSRFVLISEYGDKVIFTELKSRSLTETEMSDAVSKMKADSEAILKQFEENADAEIDASAFNDYMADNFHLVYNWTDKSNKNAKVKQLQVEFRFTKNGNFLVSFKDPSVIDSKSNTYRTVATISFSKDQQKLGLFESSETFIEALNEAIEAENARVKKNGKYVSKEVYAKLSAEEKKALKAFNLASKSPLGPVEESKFLKPVSFNLNEEGDMDNLKSNVGSSDMVGAPRIGIVKIAGQGLETPVVMSTPPKQPVVDKSNVTPEEYKKFVDDGILTDRVKELIVNKMKSNKQLTKEEEAIYQAHASVIENELRVINTTSGAKDTLTEKEKLQQELAELEAERDALESQYGVLDAVIRPEYQDLMKRRQQVLSEISRANKILETYTPENEEQLEDFLGWVRAALPDFISVEVTDKIKERMHNEGLTVGEFIMRAVPGARNIADLKGRITILSDSPAKYHEAFHAVFRMMLSDEQIRFALKQGERELRAELRKQGITMSEHMETYKRLSPFYANMTSAELKERLVEEHLADKFEEFKKNPKGTKTASANKSIFRKIIDFLINLFTDYPTARLMSTVELFEAIDSGKFRTSRVQSNIFTRETSSMGETRAYSILPLGSKTYTVGRDAEGKAITNTIETYANPEDNIRVLNGITAYVYERLKGLNSSGNQLEGTADVNKVIEEAIRKYVNLYNPERAIYDTSDKKKRASDIRTALARSASVEFDADGNALVSYPIVEEYVMENIKMFDAVNVLMDQSGLGETTQDVQDDIEDELGGQGTDNVNEGAAGFFFFENAETIGGIKGLPALVRAMIGTTSVTASDPFGNEFFVDEDGNPTDQRVVVPASMQMVYNGIVRIAADATSEQQLFERLYNYRRLSEGNSAHEELNAFIDQILAKFNLVQEVIEEDGTVREILSYDNVKNTQLYQAFTKAFDKSKREYLFFSVDVLNSEVRVYNANRKGETAAQYNSWKEAWEYKFAKVDEDKQTKVDLADAFDKLSKIMSIDSSIDTFNRNRKALKEVLQTISNLSGIEISEDYVAYSYYANLLESGKDVTAADIPEKYYYIYDRIGISFIQAAGVSGNKLGDLGLLSKSILEDSGKGLFLRDFADEADEQTDKKDSVKTIDLGGRMLSIAAGNVYFNPNVDITTFENAEFNNIQTYQSPTVLVKKINQLKDQGRIEELLADPYLKDHWLLNNNEFLSVLQSIKTLSTDGLAARSHSSSKSFGINNNPGHTYGDFTDREFLLTMLSTYSKRNDIINGVVTSPVFIRVLEASQTGMHVTMPIVKAIRYESNSALSHNKTGFVFTEEFKNILASDLSRDLDRIARVQNQREGENGVAQGVDVVKGYNVLTEKAIDKYIVENTERVTDEKGNEIVTVPTRDQAIEALRPTLKGLQINDDFRQFIVDGFVAQGMSEQDAEAELLALEQGAASNYVVNEDGSVDVELKKETQEKVIQALLFGLEAHFQDFMDVLNDEGFLVKNKEGRYTFDTQKKKGKSGNPLLGVLGADALSYLNPKMAEDLNLQQDYIQSEKKNRKNVKLDPKRLEANLAQIFFNNFINSRAINQAVNGDHKMLFKDPIDVVKRAKGLNAAGVYTNHSITDTSKGITHSFDQVGQLQHLLFESDEFTGEHSKSSQERDDGQLYMTVKGLRHVLFGMGRLSDAQASMLDRLEKGENIPLSDIFGDKNKRGSVQLNTQTNSLKLVYYDGKTYLKMSAFVLTPSFTKAEAEKAALGDVDGGKQPAFLDNLRRTLEAQEKASNSVVFGSPESASKTYKPNVISRDQIGPGGLEDNLFAKLDPNYLIFSTETPSNKLEVTDPTQMMNIILAEYGPAQDSLPVFIRGEETTVGALKEEYMAKGASVIRNKYFGTREELFDIEEVGQEINKSRALGKVTPKLDAFRKSAVEILKEIGAPQQEIDMFTDPDIDLNNAVTYNRFQNMILSKFSKNVFKQKVNGYKLTLVSDSGVKVIRKRDTAKLNGTSVDTVIPYEEFKKINPRDKSQYYSDDLRYNVEVYNESGDVIERYSEMVMPQHRRDQKLGEDIFAVRIPSQDKHSAISAKVVDFMDPYYGSVAVFPKELIEISGADFDIDSVFVHSKISYQTSTGEYVNHGEQTTDEERYEAYLNYQYKSNYEVRKLYKEMQSAEGRFEEEMNYKDRLASRPDDLKIALRQLGLPATQEEYLQAVKDNDGIDINAFALANDRLDIKRALMSTDYINSPVTENGVGRAQEVANLKPFEDFEEFMESEEGLAAFMKELERNGRITDSMLGQVQAFSDIHEGAENIGPAVNMAVAFSIMNAYGIRTNGDNAFKFGDQDLSRFDQSVNADGQRKMNVLSALITGMTDNAKEQLAKRFGLNIEAVGIVGYFIAGGMSFNDAILIINQPVIKEYFKVLKNSKSTLKFAKDQGNPKKVIANLIDTIEAVYKDKEGEDPAEDFSAQNREQLIKGLEFGSKGFGRIINQMSKEQLRAQLQFLVFFEEANDNANVLRDFAKLTKLSRGLGKTLVDFDDYIQLSERFTSREYLDALSKMGIADNFDTIFDNHHVLKQQMDIIQELDSLFPTVFITRSSFINDFRTTLINALGVSPWATRDFNKGYTRDMVSILMAKAYMFSNTKNGAAANNRNLSNALIYDSLKEGSGTNDIVTIVRELKAHLDAKGTPSQFLNDFIRTTGATKLDGTANAKNKDGVNKIGINSYTKLSPQSMHIFNAEFVDLFTNTDTFEEGPLKGTTVRGAIADMMNYLLVKDGLSFRSGTFLSYIPALALKDIVKVMSSVTETLKDSSTVQNQLMQVLGENKEQFFQEFLMNWPRHISSQNYIMSLFKPNYKEDSLDLEIYNETIREITAEEVAGKKTKEENMLTYEEKYAEEGDIIVDFWAYKNKLQDAKDPAADDPMLSLMIGGVISGAGFNQIGVKTSEGSTGKTAFPLYIRKGNKLYKLKVFTTGKIDGKHPLGYANVKFSGRSESLEYQILENTRNFTVGGVANFFGNKAVYTEVSIQGERAQFGGGYVFGELPEYIVKKKKGDKKGSDQEASNDPDQELAALKAQMAAGTIKPREFKPPGSSGPKANQLGVLSGNSPDVEGTRPGVESVEFDALAAMNAFNENNLGSKTFSDGSSITLDKFMNAAANLSSGQSLQDLVNQINECN